jgi:hypothetical protein
MIQLNIFIVKHFIQENGKMTRKPMLDSSITRESAFMATLENRLQAIQQEIKQRLVLRWTLANIAGWSAGLFLGTLVAQLAAWVLGDVAGQIVGPLLAGAVVGAVVGWLQRRALSGLFVDSPEIEAGWLTFSIIGGVVGSLSLVITWATIFIGSMGYVVMGAVFGLAFGWLQTSALKDHFGEVTVIWVGANVVGGGLCSVLTFTGVPFNLPVFCTFGPVTFGIITGLALKALLREAEVD